MSQTALETKTTFNRLVEHEAISPEQIICIHPLVEQSDHTYRFIATVASNDNLKRYDALVIVANPCLAAINKAIRETLGQGWFATQWRIA